MEFYSIDALLMIVPPLFASVFISQKYKVKGRLNKRFTFITTFICWIMIYMVLRGIFSWITKMINQ